MSTGYKITSPLSKGKLRAAVSKTSSNDANIPRSPTAATSAKKPTRTIPYILNGELYTIVEQNGDFVKVKCVNCPDDRLYRGSIRSTGNFHMHIKRRHPNLLSTLQDMKVKSLLVRRYRTNRLRCSDKESEASTSIPVSPAPSHDLKIKRVFKQHEQQAALQTLNSLDVAVEADVSNNYTHNTVLPASVVYSEQQQQQSHLIAVLPNLQQQQPFAYVHPNRPASLVTPLSSGILPNVNSVTDEGSVYRDNGNMKLEPIDLTLPHAMAGRRDNGMSPMVEPLYERCGRSLVDALRDLEIQLRTMNDLSRKQLELQTRQYFHRY